MGENKLGGGCVVAEPKQAVGVGAFTEREAGLADEGIVNRISVFVGDQAFEVVFS